MISGRETMAFTGMDIFGGCATAVVVGILLAIVLGTAAEARAKRKSNSLYQRMRRRSLRDH